MNNIMVLIRNNSTGSGMGSLLMANCKEEYPNTKLISFSVFPAQNTSVMVEPYNAGLTIHQIQDNCDGVFVIDNDALCNINKGIYKIKEPKYEDMNFTANGMINNITSIFRYNDSMRLNVDSFLNAMIKYPKLKYLCSSKAPFYDQDGKILNGEEYDNDMLALTKNVFDLKRSFVSNSNGALLDYRQNYYHDQRQGKDEGIFTNLSTLMTRKLLRKYEK